MPIPTAVAEEVGGALGTGEAAAKRSSNSGRHDIAAGVLYHVIANKRPAL